MSLEEAWHWLRKFDQWFIWNATVLSKKGSVTQRVLLENFLDERMLSRIKSDVTVTATTPIQDLSDSLRNWNDHLPPQRHLLKAREGGEVYGLVGMEIVKGTGMFP